MVVERGVHALTVDAVAERSGVAKSTLYRQWPSIEAVMVDVFRGAVPRIDPVEEGATFEQALRSEIDSIAKSLADPTWVQILPNMLALRRRFPEVDALASADIAGKHTTLLSILQRGEQESLIPVGINPHLVATTLIGPLIMCALFGDPAMLEDVAGYTVDRFLASYDT